MKEAHEELERLYARVDAEIAASGVTCWVRGLCCDFERVEHVLYASSLEITWVRETRSETTAAGSVLCPFWVGGRCGERERRPLGCRTYFCDEAFRDRLEAIHERYHAEIRDVCRRHGLEYRYEPFVRALASPGAPRDIPRDDAAPGESLPDESRSPGGLDGAP